MSAGPDTMRYQPVLTQYELEALSRRDFPSIRNRFTSRHSWRAGQPRSERICIDRLQMILDIIGTRLQQLSVLDIGCGNGFFCNYLAYCGCRHVTGIDSSSIHSYMLDSECDPLSEAQAVASSLGVSPTYHNADFVQLFSDASHRTTYAADVVLFMSVFHHLFNDYSDLPFGSIRITAEDALAQICGLVKAIMFFEMQENRFPEWTRNTIPAQLIRHGGFTRVELIGESDGYESTPRGVYACYRDEL